MQESIDLKSLLAESGVGLTHASNSVTGWPITALRSISTGVRR